MHTSAKRPIEEYPPLRRQLVTFALPLMEVTLRIPLPIEIARQRLLDHIQVGIVHSTGSGIFADQRSYSGYMGDNHFALDGPFGSKKWTLATEGWLRPDSIGSALDLHMQTHYGLNIFIVLFLVLGSCFFIFILFVGHHFFAAIPCIIVPILFLYTAILINVKFEAEVLKDILYNILSN